MNTEEKVRRNNKYAKAYIVPQRYEKLLPPTIALKIGTIFKELYRPYVESEK